MKKILFLIFGMLGACLCYSQKTHLFYIDVVGVPLLNRVGYEQIYINKRSKWRAMSIELNYKVSPGLTSFGYLWYSNREQDKSPLNAVSPNNTLPTLILSGPSLRVGKSLLYPLANKRRKRYRGFQAQLLTNYLYVNNSRIGFLGDRSDEPGWPSSNYRHFRIQDEQRIGIGVGLNYILLKVEGYFELFSGFDVNCSYRIQHVKYEELYDPMRLYVKSESDYSIRYLLISYRPNLGLRIGVPFLRQKNRPM